MPTVWTSDLEDIIREFEEHENERRENHERYYPGRWVRHAVISADFGNF